LSKVGEELFYRAPAAQRRPNLIYLVETSTNLGSGVWTNTGSSVIGTNVTAGRMTRSPTKISMDAPRPLSA
jgi:hypothetical protein